MSAPQRDVLIVGGGMVGASLAVALACGPTPLRVTMVESFPLLRAGATSYQPSFDARSTALSLSSAAFFSRLGLWQEMRAHAEPIMRIHVSDRGRFGSTRMDATQEGLEALGYVVENQWLGSVLHRRLEGLGQLEVFAPASVERVTVGSEGVSALLSRNGVTQQLQASLVVIADGARSGLAHSLGIATEQDEYRQHALITNIAHREAHRGRAFERFTGEGPMAMLPLPDAPQGQPRSALVWVLPPERADETRELSEAAFLARLQARFGYRLGKLLRCGERHAYPLALLRATEQVRSGIVVLGNAAHALHPVAGQGFNLSVRDVEALSELLCGAAQRGEALGGLALLEQFVLSRQPDQARTIGFSDGLPRLFGSGMLPLVLVRDMGLIGLDLLPAARSLLVHQATGLVAQ